MCGYYIYTTTLYLVGHYQSITPSSIHLFIYTIHLFIHLTKSSSVHSLYFKIPKMLRTKHNKHNWHKPFNLSTVSSLYQVMSYNLTLLSSTHLRAIETGLPSHQSDKTNTSTNNRCENKIQDWSWWLCEPCSLEQTA